MRSSPRCRRRPLSPHGFSCRFLFPPRRFSLPRLPDTASLASSSPQHGLTYQHRRPTARFRLVWQRLSCLTTFRRRSLGSSRRHRPRTPAGLASWAIRSSLEACGRARRSPFGLGRPRSSTIRSWTACIRAFRRRHPSTPRRQGMVPRLHYSFPLTSSKHPIFAVCTPIYCLELLIMNLRGLKSPCYHQLVGQMR